MDATSITIILIIALFAIVAIVAFWFYRSRAKVSIKGPFGTSLDVDAEQDTPKSQRVQQMKKSDYGDQEMGGQGSVQQQTMDDSPHGKQKMK